MKNFVYKAILKILKRNLPLAPYQEISIERDYLFPKLATKLLLQLSLNKIKNNGLELNPESPRIDFDIEPKKRLYKLENDQKIVLNF